MDDEYDKSGLHQNNLPKSQENSQTIENQIPAITDLKTTTILVVDDDATLLGLVHEILKPKGYIVLTTLKPSRAIEIIIEHGGSVDLLITDVMMPEMNGFELAKKISLISPGIKILLMSGYTDDVISEQALVNSNMQFMAKPFSSKKLNVKIQEMIAQSIS